MLATTHDTCMAMGMSQLYWLSFQVLKLLRKAWDRRLMFTVGQSATTGEQGTVVWNEIHHKTEFGSNHSGHGYPDPNYLDNVTMELAIQGVTDSDNETEWHTLRSCCCVTWRNVVWRLCYCWSTANCKILLCYRKQSMMVDPHDACFTSCHIDWVYYSKVIQDNFQIPISVGTALLHWKCSACLEANVTGENRSILQINWTGLLDSSHDAAQNLFVVYHNMPDCEWSHLLAFRFNTKDLYLMMSLNLIVSNFRKLAHYSVIRRITGCNSADSSVIYQKNTL